MTVKTHRLLRPITVCIPPCDRILRLTVDVGHGTSLSCTAFQTVGAGSPVTV